MEKDNHVQFDKPSGIHPAITRYGYLPLQKWDGKLVRIIDDSGNAFDGECEYNTAEYMMHEYGCKIGALQIDDWLFYADRIRSVQAIPPEKASLWLGRRQHKMKLFPEPFRMIENGSKTIELRLYDEKRRKVQVGDIIRFTNTGDEEDVLRVVVEKLYVFNSFEELYRTLPLNACGYTAQTISTASSHDMDDIYTLEEQQKWGVIGIQISVL